MPGNRTVTYTVAFIEFQVEFFRDLGRVYLEIVTANKKLEPIQAVTAQKK